MTTLAQKIRHAFAVESEEDRLAPEETALLEKVAEHVSRRRLETWAIMMLESVRPLSFVGGQGICVLGPILNVAFSQADIEKVARLLEKRKSIPALMDMIEKAQAKPKVEMGPKDK
jgi:hypothetical protein